MYYLLRRSPVPRPQQPQHIAFHGPFPSIGNHNIWCLWAGRNLHAGGVRWRERRVSGLGIFRQQSSHTTYGVTWYQQDTVTEGDQPHSPASQHGRPTPSIRMAMLAAFADYPVPMKSDLDGFMSMLDQRSFDPDLSRVDLPETRSPPSGSSDVATGRLTRSLMAAPRNTGVRACRACWVHAALPRSPKPA